MDDFVQDIRDANRIEDVIEGLGYKFEHDHGTNRRAVKTGGLVVNTQRQSFFWVAKGWKGDVIKFVQLHEGLDFRQAVDWLAQRVNLPQPTWGKVNLEAIKATREKEHAFDVAQRVLAAWLQKDDNALAYVKGRGLTDATIEACGIGFSGRGTEARYKDMRGEFSLYGVDPESPAGVVVLGFQGDVSGWAKSHGIPDNEVNKDWVAAGKINGLLAVPGLVYPHYYGKRLRYLSRRHLPGHDTITNAKGEKIEWKSWNPPKALAGDRQFFFNHVWHADAQECMVVEGQMDAITLAQWGLAAIAMAGLGNKSDSLEWLKRATKKHLVIYVATDGDNPGKAGQEALAHVFGPMSRLVTWPEGGQQGLRKLVDGDVVDPEPDPLLEQAVVVGREIAQAGKRVTVSLLQRKLRTSYSRANSLIEDVLERLEAEGVGTCLQDEELPVEHPEEEDDPAQDVDENAPAPSENAADATPAGDAA